MMGTKLKNSEYRIIMAVMRRTYGWNKTADKISITQISDMTGLSRRTVIYNIENLEAKQMLSVRRHRNTKNLNEINEISFQKDYERWVVQGNGIKYNKLLFRQRVRYKEGVVQGKARSARNGQSVVQGIENKPQFLAPTKDISTKDIIKDILSEKPKRHENPENQIPFAEIVQDLNQVIQGNFRNSGSATRRLIIARWKEGFRLDDFKYVHRVKAEEWLRTDMAKYLRPETLYGNKFEGYLQQQSRQIQYQNLKTLSKEELENLE